MKQLTTCCSISLVSQLFSEIGQKKIANIWMLLLTPISLCRVLLCLVPQLAHEAGCHKAERHYIQGRGSLMRDSMKVL
jgi:hypothetical protein